MSNRTTGWMAAWVIFGCCLSGATWAERPDAVLPSVEKRFAHPTDEVPDFQKHVTPLLGRLGCNGRACHGSFQGQGGFQLSLFGYDFNSDHSQLMAEDSGRIDLEAPTESLILTKPTDADAHDGGKRYELGSWQYNLLRQWVVGGAKSTAEPKTVKVTSGRARRDPCF